MSTIMGILFGLIATPVVRNYGDRRGWSFGKQTAVFIVLLVIAALPLVLIGKLIEKAICNV